MVVKKTLAQDCKIFKNTCSLHVNHTQLRKRNLYFFVFMFLVFGNICVNAICTSAKTRRFSPNVMQRTSDIEMLAVLSKCVFHPHHCQSQPQSSLLACRERQASIVLEVISGLKFPCFLFYAY